VTHNAVTRLALELCASQPRVCAAPPLPSTRHVSLAFTACLAPASSSFPSISPLSSPRPLPFKSPLASPQAPLPVPRRSPTIAGRRHKSAPLNTCQPTPCTSSSASRQSDPRSGPRDHALLDTHFTVYRTVLPSRPFSTRTSLSILVKSPANSYAPPPSAVF
jgi:hypothetical protein